MNWSRAFKAAGRSDRRTVHAFEPQRRWFLMLSGNVALNDDVFCRQQAVGDAHLPLDGTERRTRGIWTRSRSAK
jgi:hypothetical protein